MKKRLLSLGIIICMLFGMAVMPASAAIVDSGTCGENLTWTLDDSGTLTISGTGDMWDYPRNPSWYSNTSIKTVIINKGVTSIGKSAFYYCSSLTSIKIPASVTSIGKSAFSSCSSLTSINIPNSVTSIGDRAFEDCGSLTSITIPDSVTSIGEGIFRGCGLKSVSLPHNMTSINDHMFEWCTDLESFTIPNGMTSIGDSAFRHCYSLKSVTIPRSVTSIGDSAFYECTSLGRIDLAKVSKVGKYAFYGCSALSTIIIPEWIYIDEYAFKECTSIEDIYYRGSSREGNYATDPIDIYGPDTICYNTETMDYWAIFNIEIMRDNTLLYSPEKWHYRYGSPEISKLKTSSESVTVNLSGEMYSGDFVMAAVYSEDGYFLGMTMEQTEENTYEYNLDIDFPIPVDATVKAFLWAMSDDEEAGATLAQGFSLTPRCEAVTEEVGDTLG